MKPLNLSSNSWRKTDWILILSTIILSSIGLSIIYSVDLARGEKLIFFPTQTIALFLAIILLFIISQIHISFYEATAPTLYFSSLILLVLVLIFGTTVRGTTGWFRIAGYSLQPAELAKIALILFLAWRTERQARRFERSSFVLVTGILSLIPLCLIMLQPDLGSASILAGVWFGILLIAGTKKRYIIGLLFLTLTVSVFGWFFLLKDYQKERITTFLNPEEKKLGSGYNVSQSIIAIGSGKLIGRGLGFGSQSQLHFLPEAQTDFIFSVIGEELGFIGSIIVIGLYFVIIWRLIKIAKNCRNDFSAYTTVGITLIFLLHIAINMGATIGMLPVTGVPLPFLSYGGTSLIVNFILIGIAESVSRSTNQLEK